MTQKEKIPIILETLNQLYPYDGVCFLHYDKAKPWQLLFATILSAQCTDDRVNIVTAQLFKTYPTLEAFAAAPIKDLEEGVRPTGFYRNKAAHLQNSALRLLQHYGGELPSSVEDLITLSGAGRKTANVVRSHIFNLPSIVVDTHVMRITKRLGLTQSTDPVKIEFELMKKLPKAHWIPYNQQVISHGRAVCTARSPKCQVCQLQHVCKEFK